MKVASSCGIRSSTTWCATLGATEPIVPAQRIWIER